ncbi:uncharacterized protein BDR25DRAFT_351832 [Lindgomyces ingoldianus]|uniref:Uncharacterized protein n=1 Tax=Lindgomyces ingoldianus TaxID=673940 RepID=A0ACB6R7H7_9PLEO|nr:uncharacterized protein BDR25DRAFT_351832 [Lindgomyces ingoldianus]KAF2474275.1 hypothetical protein BDR25DRAFT_351832 [Lindgomyces ingoldianus]
MNIYSRGDEESIFPTANAAIWKVSRRTFPQKPALDPSPYSVVQVVVIVLAPLLVTEEKRIIRDPFKREALNMVLAFWSLSLARVFLIEMAIIRRQAVFPSLSNRSSSLTSEASCVVRGFRGSTGQYGRGGQAVRRRLRCRLDESRGALEYTSVMSVTWLDLGVVVSRSQVVAPLKYRGGGDRVQYITKNVEAIIKACVAYNGCRGKLVALLGAPGYRGVEWFEQQKRSTSAQHHQAAKRIPKCILLSIKDDPHTIRDLNMSSRGLPGYKSVLTFQRQAKAKRSSSSDLAQGGEFRRGSISRRSRSALQHAEIATIGNDDPPVVKPEGRLMKRMLTGWVSHEGRGDEGGFGLTWTTESWSVPVDQNSQAMTDEDITTGSPSASSTAVIRWPAGWPLAQGCDSQKGKDFSTSAVPCRNLMQTRHRPTGKAAAACLLDIT